MANLGIGGTFTVSTVEDGVDAQYIYLRGTARDINDNVTQTIPCVISVTGGNDVATHVRGLNLVTINRQTLQVVGEPLYYDTYGESVDIPDRYNNGITELISKLNSLDDSVFVCLVSFDAIGWVRLTDMAAGTYPLITALQGYGMSDIQFTQTGRYPFLFIGYKNLGKGNGLTRMRDRGNYYDYVETSAYVANGALTMRDGKDGTDGENAFDVTLDNQIAGVECDKNGDIVDDINIPFRISAHYGSNDVIDACTITDNHEDVDYDIDVSYNQQQKGLVTLSLYGGNALRDTNVIAFTVVHPQYGTRIVSFTVKRIINGESAPFYSEEWYAWSNDTSTASVTTEPTISGSWSHSIPSQGGLAYLWKKIVRYDFNASTRQYNAQTAQYFRMSGTDGTSIHTKGQVANSSKRGNGTATIIQNGTETTISLSDGDAVTQLDNGHLYQWVTENGGTWLDLGQFKGESGVTYYTHIAWATNVVLSQSSLPKPAGQQNIPNATSVSGGAIIPSGADLPWMGYLIDTNVSDSTTFTNYTWSKTKGAKGEDAVAYEIQTSVESVKIPSNQSSTSRSITFRFYSKEGQSDRQAFTTYYSIYYRNVNNAYTLVYPPTSFARSSYTYTFSNIGTSVSAIVVYIWGNTDYRGDFPEGQTYLAKKEISILKDGNDGQAGERGKVGRFYYYSDFDWDADNVDDTFVVNDAQVPYFSKAGSNANKYYVFNPETIPASGEMTMAQMAAETSVGGQIQWNEAPWEVMTDDFKYLITKAIFGDYAEFGSFIINGDWLFSKLGQWLGNTTTDNGKVNYYAFNNGSISYVKNSPVYGYVNANDPIQSSENIYRDATNANDTIYYPLEEGSYLSLTSGIMYYLRLRCVKCKVYLCYENYEVELQQFPTAQQEGGLVPDQGDSYYIGSWLFQVEQSGNYLIKVVRDDVEVSYRPSNTVTWIEIDKKYFVPNFATNGYNGKTVTGDLSANGTFYGDGNFGSIGAQNIRIGGGGETIVSFFENQKMVCSRQGQEVSGKLVIDGNGFLKFVTT